MLKRIPPGILGVFAVTLFLALYGYNQTDVPDMSEGRTTAMRVESSTDQELIYEIVYRLLASEPIGLDDLVDRRGITPEFSEDVSYDSQANLAMSIQHATLVESGTDWRKYKLATTVKDSYFWILDIDGFRKLRLFLEP